MSVLIATAVGIVTSFIGSMGAFVLWIHFDLDERWRDRKEHNRLKDIQRGLDRENEERLRRGLPPVGLEGSSTPTRGYDVR